MPSTEIHGWPLPARIFRQRDYAHLQWGYGGKSWAAWGCPALALIPLVRASGIRAGETPESAQDRLRRAIPPVWAADSSSAVLPRLARTLGFSCPDTTDAWDVRAKHGGMSTREMSIAICDAIDGHGLVPKRGFAWVHVDYDGDEVGNHWIAPYAYDDASIYAVDSVPGTFITLDRKTLTAPVMWGAVEKRYRVVRGYPLVVSG